MQPRTPLAKAEATGRTLHDPQRFKDRKEPSSQPLGAPPVSFAELEKCVWEAFKREIPWLTEADRTVVEGATALRAKIWAGSRSETTIMRLATLMGRLGATPTDRSRIVVPPSEVTDPAEEFIN